LCGTRVIQGLSQVSCWYCTLLHTNNWMQ
jgi:hypothetical protein